MPDQVALLFCVLLPAVTVTATTVHSSGGVTVVDSVQIVSQDAVVLLNYTITMRRSNSTSNDILKAKFQDTVNQIVSTLNETLFNISVSIETPPFSEPVYKPSVHDNESSTARSLDIQSETFYLTPTFIDSSGPITNQMTDVFVSGSVVTVATEDSEKESHTIGYTTTKFTISFSKSINSNEFGVMNSTILSPRVTGTLTQDSMFFSLPPLTDSYLTISDVMESTFYDATNNTTSGNKNESLQLTTTPANGNIISLTTPVTTSSIMTSIVSEGSLSVLASFSTYTGSTRNLISKTINDDSLEPTAAPTPSNIYTHSPTPWFALPPDTDTISQYHTLSTLEDKERMDSFITHVATHGQSLASTSANTAPTARRSPSLPNETLRSQLSARTYSDSATSTSDITPQGRTLGSTSTTDTAHITSITDAAHISSTTDTAHSTSITDAAHISSTTDTAHSTSITDAAHISSTADTAHITSTTDAITGSPVIDFTSAEEIIHGSPYITITSTTDTAHITSTTDTAQITSTPYITHGSPYITITSSTDATHGSPYITITGTTDATHGSPYITITGTTDATHGSPYITITGTTDATHGSPYITITGTEDSIQERQTIVRVSTASTGDNTLGNPTIDITSTINTTPGSPHIDTISTTDTTPRSPNIDTISTIDTTPGNPNIDTISKIDTTPGSPNIATISTTDTIQERLTITIMSTASTEGTTLDTSEESTYSLSMDQVTAYSLPSTTMTSPAKTNSPRPRDTTIEASEASTPIFASTSSKRTLYTPTATTMTSPAKTTTSSPTDTTIAAPEASTPTFASTWSKSTLYTPTATTMTSPAKTTTSSPAKTTKEAQDLSTTIFPPTSRRSSKYTPAATNRTSEAQTTTSSPTNSTKHASTPIFPPTWDSSTQYTPASTTLTSPTPGPSELVAELKAMIKNTSDPKSLTASNVTEYADRVLNMYKESLLYIEVARNAFRVIGNLGDVNVSISNQVEEEGQINTKLRGFLDNYTAEVNLETHDGNVSIGTPQLDVRAISLEKLENASGSTFSSDFEVTDENGTSATMNVTVTLPLALLHQIYNESLDSRIQFVAFKRSQFFVPAGGFPEDGSILDNQRVLSASIKGKDLVNLTDHVVITLPAIRPGARHDCVYWNISESKWSTDGILTLRNDTNPDIITCNSSHLTSFAVLLSSQSTPLSPEHEVALTYLTFVGCGISVIGLLCTLATFAMFRCLSREKPGKILMNLCTALLLLNIAFLAATVNVSGYSDGWCLTAGMFLHYLVLASLMWMLVEALDIYQALVIVFIVYERFCLIKRCLIAWGVPVVIVAVTAALDSEAYAADKKTSGKFCFMTSDSPIPFFASLVAPSCVIIIINICVFIRVVRIVLKPNIHKQLMSDTRTVTLSQIRGAVTVMFLLGVTWVFGPLAIGPAQTAFNYLFCICNSLQGCVIFLCRCLCNKEARLAWMQLLRTGTFKSRRGPLNSAVSDFTGRGDDRRFSQSNTSGSATECSSRTTSTSTASSRHDRFGHLENYQTTADSCCVNSRLAGAGNKGAVDDCTWSKSTQTESGIDQIYRLEL